MEVLTPLRLEPVTVAKVWGASQLFSPLSACFAAAPGVGEIWLASAHEVVNKVAEGPLAGMGLDELSARCGRRLLGDAHPQLEFPLTLKLLNVGDWLSAKVSGDKGTTHDDQGEIWHVLYTEHPDTKIVMGLKADAGPEELQTALARGYFTDLLSKVPAQSGDTFFVPAGTMHTVGPGLLIFGLQQPSGVAYRFHDWDRPDINGVMRPLDYEQALQAITLRGHAPSEPVQYLEIYGAPNRIRLLLETASFSLLKVDATQTYRPWWGGAKLRVLFVLEGQGTMSSPGRYFEPLPLKAGQTWLLPALLTTPLLIPNEGSLSILEAIA
jgi:mannose-6-phosphate isomerase